MRTIVVFAHGAGDAWPFYLEVHEFVDGLGISFPGWQLNKSFQDALGLAYQVATPLVGGKGFQPGVTCNLTRIGPEDHPPLAGGSLFGALSMAVIQLLANGSGAGREKEMRHQVRAQLTPMRCADLSTVAVSAAGNLDTGDFRPVDGIEEKLRSLARLGPEKLRDIPVIYALDPIDALGQLYERQCRASAEAHELRCKASAQAFERRCKALAERIA